MQGEKCLNIVFMCENVIDSEVLSTWFKIVKTYTVIFIQFIDRQ